MDIQTHFDVFSILARGWQKTKHNLIPEGSASEADLLGGLGGGVPRN